MTIKTICKRIANLISQASSLKTVSDLSREEKMLILASSLATFCLLPGMFLEVNNDNKCFVTYETLLYQFFSSKSVHVRKVSPAHFFYIGKKIKRNFSYTLFYFENLRKFFLTFSKIK